MRENRLRQLLNEGKPTFATRVHSTWPTMTELVGRSGQFDYVEFLAEYAERMRRAYPPRPYGTVLPFRRVFVVAQHQPDRGPA